MKKARNLSVFGLFLCLIQIVERTVFVEVDHRFCLCQVYILFHHIQCSVTQNLLQSVDVSAVFKICSCKGMS